MRSGFRASVIAVPILLVAVGSACFPDPKADYDDFIARSGEAGTPIVVSDAAAFDSKPPDTAVSELYAGICVSALSARDPTAALRFYTESKFTPATDGSGTLTLTLTPLVGWDTAAGSNVSPTSISKSETRGNPIGVGPLPVSAGGRFTANLGTLSLPAAANSISGRDATLERTVFDGLFSAGDRFCATLAGQLTKPYQATFDPKANTCLFQRVKDGDPLPNIPAGEFVCNF